MTVTPSYHQGDQIVVYELQLNDEEILFYKLIQDFHVFEILPKHELMLFYLLLHLHYEYYLILMLETIVVYSLHLLKYCNCKHKMIKTHTPL